MQSPRAGRVACFLGTVRDHHGGREVLRLEYSAYDPMAEAECARIVAGGGVAVGRARSRCDTGSELCEIGDAAVAVVVASAHRDEAFVACRYVIEEVKRRVPIWKREVFADGSVEWVGSSGERSGEARELGSGRTGQRSHETTHPRVPAPRLPTYSVARSKPADLRHRSLQMRCRYCMPEQEYVWLPRESILSFEEIDRLVGIFAGLGVDKLRLTGGEPLLRHELPKLVALLRRRPGSGDIALTTNGILLARHAAELRAAGLDRVTVSLDTLRPERMLEFARSARHAGRAARNRGRPRGRVRSRSSSTSWSSAGYNDDELIDLVEFGRAQRRRGAVHRVHGCGRRHRAGRWIRW